MSFTGTILRIPTGAATHGDVTTAQRLGYDSRARLLIVNADDFGMCDEANRALIEGLSRGVFTSASVMVPTPGFPEAARFARAHPELDVGVHLALTSEWNPPNRWPPLLGGSTVPSLVDGDGYMWRTPAEVFAKCLAGEIEAELRAQLERAFAAGIDVSHIDSHMFALHSLSAPCRRIYLNLARDYCLPIRAARSALLLPVGIGSILGDFPMPLRAARRAFMLRTAFASIVAEGERLGIMFPDNLVIFGPSRPQDSESHWTEVLRRLPPGLTEIYCHPMLATPQVSSYVADADTRAADFEFFSSERARSLVAAENIELLGHRPLRAAMRERGGSAPVEDVHTGG